MRRDIENRAGEKQDSPTRFYVPNFEDSFLSHVKL
jgi:hypothetical protein